VNAGGKRVAGSRGLVAEPSLTFGDLAFEDLDLVLPVQDSGAVRVALNLFLVLFELHSEGCNRLPLAFATRAFPFALSHAAWVEAKTEDYSRSRTRRFIRASFVLACRRSARAILFCAAASAGVRAVSALRCCSSTWASSDRISSRARSRRCSISADVLVAIARSPGFHHSTDFAAPAISFGLIDRRQPGQSHLPGRFGSQPICLSLSTHAASPAGPRKSCPCWSQAGAHVGNTLRSWILSDGAGFSVAFRFAYSRANGNAGPGQKGLPTALI
jgi:hypothetical protein